MSAVCQYSFFLCHILLRLKLFKLNFSRLGKRSIESIPEETNVPRISQSSKVERSDGSKVPKWFKPSKK